MTDAGKMWEGRCGMSSKNWSSIAVWMVLYTGTAGHRVWTIVGNVAMQNASGSHKHETRQRKQYITATVDLRASWSVLDDLACPKAVLAQPLLQSRDAINRATRQPKPPAPVIQDSQAPAHWHELHAHSGPPRGSSSASRPATHSASMTSPHLKAVVFDVSPRAAAENQNSELLRVADWRCSLPQPAHCHCRL